MQAKNQGCAHRSLAEVRPQEEAKLWIEERTAALIRGTGLRSFWATRPHVQEQRWMSVGLRIMPRLTDCEQCSVVFQRRAVLEGSLPGIFMRLETA